MSRNRQIPAEFVRELKSRNRKRDHNDPLFLVSQKKPKTHDYLGEKVAPCMNLVSREQMERAVAASQEVLEHARKNRGGRKAQLWDDDTLFSLVLTFTSPLGKTTPLSGVVLPLPHSFYQDPEFCLITRDPHAEWKGKFRHVKKVLGVSRLRTRYERFEARRKLAKSYDLFLAEPQVLFMLPKLIGASFFRGNHQPVPLSLTRAPETVQAEIDSLASSTRFFVRRGVNCEVKVGSTLLSPKQLTENAMAVLPELVARIPGGWGSIQSVAVRFEGVLPLPVFRHLPAVPKTLESFVRRKSESSESESDGDSQDAFDSDDDDDDDNDDDDDDDSETFSEVDSSSSDEE